MPTLISWMSSLPFLSRTERETLAALRPNADARIEHYRVIHMMLTDPEIGLQRYYAEDRRLNEYANLIVALQEKCLTGIVPAQELWSPMTCGSQTEARKANAEVRRFPKRGKGKPTDAELALAMRRACVADALESAAYHSYSQQGPATVVAIFDAMVAIAGLEARRIGQSHKDAEKQARALYARRIFELLSTNISVEQPPVTSVAA